MLLGAAVLLAADAPGAGTGNVADTFLQYGAIGAVLLAVMALCYRLITREQKRSDTAEQALSEQNQYMRETVIPAFVESTRTLAEVAKVMPEVGRLLPEILLLLRERERDRR